MRAGASGGGGGFVLSTLGNDRQVVLLRNVPFPSLARALVLRPPFVDWARLHFGKAPNVSIVAAGGGEGRRRRRPTKPRQGHKHHENMVLSGRQPAANEATERCRTCSTYLTDLARPGCAVQCVQCMHGTSLNAQDCLVIQSLWSPLRTPDKKASDGVRRLDD